jgi:hypothetical protein
VTKNWREKIYCRKKDSIKDVQATGEAFCPQKRTSSTSKNENALIFYLFLGNFCPPGSESGSSNSIQCRSGSEALLLTENKSLNIH